MTTLLLGFIAFLASLVVALIMFCAYLVKRLLDRPIISADPKGKLQIVRHSTKDEDSEPNLPNAKPTSKLIDLENVNPELLIAAVNKKAAE